MKSFPEEMDGLKVEISKSGARDILRQSFFMDADLFDRHNLELLLRNYVFDRKLDFKVLPDLEERNKNVRIGWGFNYCIGEPIVDRNVTENVLEIPLLKEFLARGCSIDFIGKSTAKFQKFHPKMTDHSHIWKCLPQAYKPVGEWIIDCCTNYEDYEGFELPEVDLVIMNAFPSFPFTNMMFYLISMHYAELGVPVFLWDPELRTLRTKDQPWSKPFSYSGADKFFDESVFEKIASNSFWLLQIPSESLTKIKQLNPSIRIIPFFPPYSMELGLFNINPKPRYRLTYVGNDSERRATFRKFFTPLSKKNKLHLFGGGMSRRTEGYQSFDQYVGNTKMHGPIEQDQVWRTYNMSRTCLSIARPRYYDLGWIVHRWLEVVLSGCILLVPREMYGIEKYMNDNFLVGDSDELEKKVSLFNRVKMSSLEQANNMQKKLVYSLFSSERGVSSILRAMGK